MERRNKKRAGGRQVGIITAKLHKTLIWGKRPGRDGPWRACAGFTVEVWEEG